MNLAALASLARKPSPKVSARYRALQWAVWLGATTSSRLAREWRISQSSAKQMLSHAAKIGLVEIDRRHDPLQYSVKEQP